MMTEHTQMALLVNNSLFELNSADMSTKFCLERLDIWEYNALNSIMDKPRSGTKPFLTDSNA